MSAPRSGFHPVESLTNMHKASTRLRAWRASLRGGHRARQRPKMTAAITAERGVATPQLSATEKPKMKAQNKAPGVKAPDSVLKGTAGPIVGNNDDLSLNPQGRDGSDSSNQRDKLLSCRHHLNVATMNVRTIKKESKRQELMHNCVQHNISILGIVDHKIVHSHRVPSKII